MIEVRQLVKQYGSFTAVNNISFQVEKGCVLGFLGPNGAGKSTTMKIITCFMPPTSGTVVVEGNDILQQSIAVRSAIGYLPESAPSYGEMTPYEFLSFTASARGLSKAATKSRIDEVMHLCGMNEVRNQLIETLSKGYRQRVGVSQALLHDPPVLILDEPTDGLDPNQKHDMRALIRQMSAEKTIILSTHILEEMEAVCDRAIIINRGEIVADSTPAALAAKSRHHQAVVLRSRQWEALKAQREALEALPFVDRTEWQAPNRVPNENVAENAADRKAAAETAKGASLTLFPQGGQMILPQVLAFLNERSVNVDDVYVERGHMDDVFRQVTS